MSIKYCKYIANFFYVENVPQEDHTHKYNLLIIGIAVMKKERNFSN